MIPVPIGCRHHAERAAHPLRPSGAPPPAGEARDGRAAGAQRLAVAPAQRLRRAPPSR
jgi:hypothetical protein